MKAVVYARYSSHRQGEQSIGGQLAEAQRFALERDMMIVHEYVDRALTGKNDSREQFQLMLADATKKVFDALIVWKTDRIGRNKEEIALNKYHLKKNGVKIFYVAEHIPDTPEGIILESVIEGMAAYFSEQLSQNVKRGMYQSAAKAQSTGGSRPLGYLTGPDKRLVIDPETAPTVKKIYELYGSGKTIAEIVRYLNAQGLRTLTGSPFTQNSLRTVLKNEKYIGVYTYKDELRLEGAVPPLVEPEVFQKVQEMLKYNQKAAAHKNSPADYLLTEKLFCGKCGKMMVGLCGTSKTGARYYYYCCGNQRKKLCTKKAIPRDWIENLVLEYAVALVHNEELMEFIAENTYQYYLEQNTDSAYTESLHAALAETNKAMNNLVKAMEAGIFNETTKTRMDELDNRKAELEASIADSQLKIDLGIKKEHILYFLHRFAEFDIEDKEYQKRLIKTFINSVFVYDDKVVLTFNYSGDNRTISVMEIDAGLAIGVRLPRGLAYQNRPTSQEVRKRLPFKTCRPLLISPAIRQIVNRILHHLAEQAFRVFGRDVH
jgi:DNA invertase Pin-like site-specific DNA recombinase